MTQALAIAARELRERWILFPAALAFGFVPIVLPAFRPDFRDIAPVVGVAFAVVLGATAAVVVGSTMLARDAAMGRLAFLLARPVSLASVWAGKWIAALVLVLGSGLLAAVPWMAVTTPPEAHGGSWLSALANGPGTPLFLGLAVLAVGLANFNAAAFRSRSAWLALDLALLVTAVLVVRRYFPPFAQYGLVDALVDIVHFPSLAVWILAVAGLLGSAAQLVVGRTDLRRAHRALSTARGSSSGRCSPASSGRSGGCARPLRPSSGVDGHGQCRRALGTSSGQRACHGPHTCRAPGRRVPT
ncbi:MAG: hypothetical protein U0599_14815 [Vicinamibacteria bacterium]